MSRLREVRVFDWGGPDPAPMNVRFARVCEPITRELRERLQTIELQARYRILALPLVSGPERDDSAVRWWLEEAPSFEFEQAPTSLPGPLSKLEDDQQRSMFVHLLRAVLDRLTPLRGWDPDAVRALTNGLIPDWDHSPAIPLVYVPPPAISIWGGGGPANDRRTRRYLQRNGDHAELFRSDPAWWDWWLSTGRAEVDMSILFEGSTALRVTVTEKKITLGRVREPASIPTNSARAYELADRDLLEALARLRKRLDLPVHPDLVL